jgi:hypothetical protein
VCKAFLDPLVLPDLQVLKEAQDPPVLLDPKERKGFKVCPDRLVPQEAPAPQALLDPSALRDPLDLKV